MHLAVLFCLFFGKIKKLIFLTMPLSLL
uniref:Uncharacterized protein n=1 Tax=Arundo donax TaxID=35708 RepID=A0A0A8ZNQ4_ARUDO